MIWGAGGGIGRALVARLAAENWTVVAFSRRPAELAAYYEGHKGVLDL